MHSTSRMSKLVATIQQQQSILDSRIQALNTTSPSFENGISPPLMFDPVAAVARQTLLNASTELTALMKGPQGILTSPSHNYWVSLHIIVKFGIAAFIPLDSEEGRTFAQIGEAVGLDAGTVKRVLRHAKTLYIFAEEPAGFIRHNAASRFLATNPPIRQAIEMNMDELWPAAAKLASSLRKWPGSQEPNECGFNMAHNTNLPAFQDFSRSPERMKRFADTMTYVSKGPGMEVRHLVDGYPWQDLACGNVVDIGGSMGTASVEIAKKFPSIDFIVQDREEVAEEGKKSLSAESGKISFMAHDFFEEQPVKNANVYLLRQILHDWSDLYAAKILRAVVPAMNADSRIVIMDHILPESGVMHPNKEYPFRTMDLAMLALQNGRERDAEDWKNLFHQVDPRLELTRIIQPPQSRMALVEARLVIEEVHTITLSEGEIVHEVTPVPERKAVQEVSLAPKEKVTLAEDTQAAATALPEAPLQFVSSVKEIEMSSTVPSPLQLDLLVEQSEEPSTPQLASPVISAVETTPPLSPTPSFRDAESVVSVPLIVPTTQKQALHSVCAIIDPEELDARAGY